MASARDDFSIKVKRELAHRVGMRCSDPNCRAPTSGPKSGSAGAVNIGVAAHISAAAKGGKRYDPHLSASERASIDNGLWLCQNCAWKIDSDEELHSPGLLRTWKEHSEKAAQMELGTRGGSRLKDSDIVQFFAVCLDRPAFHDVFHQERSTEDFDKALEDTITAFNTGTLRSRDGVVLQTHRGKSYVRDPATRAMLDAIVEMLRAMRSRYVEAKRAGEVVVHNYRLGESSYCVYDQALAEWFDGSRLQVLGLFKKAADLTGVGYVVPTQAMRIVRNTQS